MRAANLGLKFLLELAAIVANAWGFIGIFGLWPGIVFAIVAIGFFISVWARWCAPRAAKRLRTPVRIPVELALLGYGAVVLAFVAPIAAAVDAGLIILNALLLTAFKQWDG